MQRKRDFLGVKYAKNRILLMASLMLVAACEYHQTMASRRMWSASWRATSICQGISICIGMTRKVGFLFVSIRLQNRFSTSRRWRAGIGSNDIGLDRGQLGATKVVEFQRSGPKILLVEDNLDYRAVSDDVDEQNAVDESFARSVVWGF